ncbi:unnamed protein product [Gadus morhua 'NCC']
MAALWFSVLMREWGRGMVFDPWHGSLYLRLSTVITLSPSAPLSLAPSLSRLSVSSSSLNLFLPLSIAPSLLPPSTSHSITRSLLLSFSPSFSYFSFCPSTSPFHSLSLSPSQPLPSLSLSLFFLCVVLWMRKQHEV